MFRPELQLGPFTSLEGLLSRSPSGGRSNLPGTESAPSVLTSLCFSLLLMQPTHWSSWLVSVGTGSHQVASPNAKNQCNPVDFPKCLIESKWEVQKWINTKWQSKAGLRDSDQLGSWPQLSTMPLNWNCAKPRSGTLASITATGTPQLSPTVLKQCRFPIS